MPRRYFKRRWEESRDDRHDSWGASTWYFEVDEEGWPTRQLEVYDAGPTLRYGPGHAEDAAGRLSQSQLDELEDWTPWTVTADEFERAWKTTE
jgi:hypothetical protein